MPHFRITQASLISALAFIVGQLVAFVPAFGPDKQALISGGTAIIAAVFLVANAIHALASSKVTVADLEHAAEQAAKEAVGKLDFNSLAREALSGNLGAAVRAELQKLLGAGLTQVAPQSAPATVTPITGAPQSPSPTGSGPLGA